MGFGDAGVPAVSGDEDGFSPILLREGCSIGAGAIVVAGTRVGRFATVGAGAVVTRDVADHALVVGNPARRLGWVCACGQRLRDAADRPGPADTDGGVPPGGLACAACGRTYARTPGDASITPSSGPHEALAR